MNQTENVTWTVPIDRCTLDISFRRGPSRYMLMGTMGALLAAMQDYIDGRDPDMEVLTATMNHSWAVLDACSETPQDEEAQDEN